MNEMTTVELECRTFTRYLVGHEPQPDVIRKYAEAHRIDGTYSGGDRFGLVATRLARSHPLVTKLADSHARLFVPRGLLRKKLVLLLAILETSASSYRLIDEIDSASRALLIVRLAARGTGSVLSLFIGSLLLLPLQLTLGLVSPGE